MAIGFSSAVSAVMWPVVRSSTPFIEPNQLATSAESLSSGRASLMFVYLNRTGSWCTNRLLPPSSRCSSTTSHPRPSHDVNRPSRWWSISTWK